MNGFLTFSLTPAGSIFKLYMTIVMLQALFIAMEAFVMKRSRRYKTVMLFNLLMIGFLCTVAFNITTEAHMAHRLQSAFMVSVCNMPAILYVTVTLLAQIIVIISAADIIRYKKSHFTDSLVKEMIDNLPAGIMISDDDGTVIMANLQMNRLARVMTGTYTANANNLIYAVIERNNNGRSKETCAKSITPID